MAEKNFQLTPDLSLTDVSMKNLDEVDVNQEEASQPILSFNKRPGTCSINGQIFDIDLIISFLLQGIIKKQAGQIIRFSLTSNMIEAEDFDNVFFKYVYTDGIEMMENVIFLQSRHKENPEKPNEKITLERLLSDTNKKEVFSLKAYFTSFNKIKKTFITQNTTENLILNSKFEDCSFIVFTNAEFEVNEMNQKNLKKLFIGEEDFLNCKIANYYYQIILDGDLGLNYKIKSILENSSDCRQLAKELVKSLFTSEKCAEITSQGIVKRYRNALAEHVIEKRKFKEGAIRQSFLDAANVDYQQFRDTFFDEICKQRQKSIDEILPELKLLKIKVPDTFWNFEEKAILPTDLVTQEDITEFLSRLKLFTSQPNVAHLERILKDKMQSTFEINSNDIQPIFADVQNKVEKWWKEDNVVLTENNQFFQETIRINIIFDVKQPVRIFTGRKHELEDLHRKIQRNSVKMTVISQVTSISGLGGIGKTELARQYIQNYRKEYDNNIIWINAENESILTKSFQRLAQEALKIDIQDANGKNKDIESILEQVYKFFKKRKSLFIFDNADQPDVLQNVLPYLTSDDHKLFILITSRKREWGNNMEVLDLNELNLEEAIMLVKKGLDIGEEDISQNVQIINLVEKLQCFPLAIQQAIAYIKQQDLKIEVYLEEYERRARDLLSFEEFQQIDDLYTKTTFTTWQISMDKIKSYGQFGELSLKILNLIAYFAAENIPRSIFLELADKRKERLLKEAVRILVNLSLINGEQKQRVLSIHRLVQEVIRIKLKAEFKEQIILENNLELIKNNYSIEVVDHAISIWNNGCDYKELIKNYSEFPSEITKSLTDNNKYRQACSFGLNNCEMLDNILEQNHLDLLEIKYNTALALYKNGQCDKPLDLFQKILAIHSQLWGPDDLKCLKILFAMANVLVTRGNYDDALKHSKRILKIQTETLEEEHPDILSTESLIASIFQSKGNYVEALDYYKKICEKQKNRLGENHRDTLNTMNNLAIAFRCIGDYDRALNHNYTILERRTKSLGGDHPDTLGTMTNLAVVYSLKKDYISALKYYQQVIKKYAEILGVDHPIYLTAVLNATNLINDMGDHNNALSYYQEIFEKRKEILGERHPDTLLVMNNIAHAYLFKDEFDIAIQYYEKLLDIQIQKYGDEHPNTLLYMHGHATALLCKSNIQGALELYEKVFEKRKRKLGDQHPDTLQTQEALTATLALRDALNSKSS